MDSEILLAEAISVHKETGLTPKQAVDYFNLEHAMRTGADNACKDYCKKISALTKQRDELLAKLEAMEDRIFGYLQDGCNNPALLKNALTKPHYIAVIAAAKGGAA